MQKLASQTTDTYLLLGTNMGDRPALLTQALAEIAHEIGIITRISSIYETAAWGNENQAPYLNQVVKVTTIFSAEEVLGKSQAIEKKLGRERHAKWEARLMDIDILFYGNKVIDTDELKVPHPYLAQRRFTLAPLQEIAPHYLHPVLHKTVTELLDLVPDPLPVAPYHTTDYEPH